MNSYIELFKILKSDYLRYSSHYMGGHFFRLIKVLIHERGFVFTFFLRMASVKSLLRPFFWLIYHHLCSKYGIQISSFTKIGSGFYLGHGVGVVINKSAEIGSNVTISQFVTIGSSKGKAATIADNVYIGPSVCLVEDVIIGHDSIVGAGSVVTKNVPPLCMVAGNPAKIIKKYNLETKNWDKFSN